MSTGNKATLYDKIDALASCVSWEDACPHIQAILSNMAYYVINSDGAILEAHEEWHEDFTDRLRQGVGQKGDSKKASGKIVGAVSIDAPPRKGAKSGRPPKSASKPIPRSDTGLPAKARAAPVERDVDNGLGDSFEPRTTSRPAKSRGGDKDQLDDVPDSLKAIMLGTHPSLNQEDDDDGNFFARAGRSGKGR